MANRYFLMGFPMLAMFLCIDIVYHDFLTRALDLNRSEMVSPLFTAFDRSIPIMIVIICLLPAVVEETAFRGLLQEWLARCVNERWVFTGIALLFALSFIFVDYKILWRDFVNTISPLKIEEIVIESGDLTSYIEVTKLELKEGGTRLILELRRGKDFPATYDRYREDRESAEAQKDLARLMMLNAIIEGQVVVEYRDEKDEVISSLPLRIRELFTKEKITVTVPYDRQRRPAKLKITY